jgi:hypothetical protein
MARGTLINQNYTEKQYTLTVTGTDWTTSRAVGMPYKTIDGAWRLTFNIYGTLSAASSKALTVAGVVFKTGGDQASSVKGDSASGWGIAYCNTGTGIIAVYLNASVAGFCVSGDVELGSKPTFVP